MRRELIWDLPVRVFHLVFAGGVVTAATIALATDDEGPVFPHHAMIGMTVGVALGLRILWGIVGSRHARFASFPIGPASIAHFVRTMRSGRAERHPGHNPGAAAVMILMFVLLAGLVATGIALGRGNEQAEDVHEILAYAMLAAIAAHLAGLVMHTVMHREVIAASMIDGRKLAEPADAIRSRHPVAAVVFLAVVGTFAVALWSSYDRATATARIPVIGTELRFTDAEHAPGTGHDEGEDDG